VQVICFRLASAAYAIPLEDVADVSPAGPVRAVPGAPPGVRGLAERHGRAVAVLDGPRLLDDPGTDPVAGYLLRFRAPHGGTALWIPARIAVGRGERVTTGTGDVQGGRPEVLVGGERHVLLDIETLIQAAA
jgi:hypothetical protein